MKNQVLLQPVSSVHMNLLAMGLLLRYSFLALCSKQVLQSLSFLPEARVEGLCWVVNGGLKRSVSSVIHHSVVSHSRGRITALT